MRAQRCGTPRERYAPTVSARDVQVEVGATFLEALAVKDYNALGTCFAENATLRGVVPPGLREADGREAIVERFRIWTADIEEYEISDCDAVPFADLLRLRWVVQGVDPELGLNAYEQTAYAEVEGAEIVAMRLACSGHRSL